ncbi:MAG TPA: hypothetical protein VM487_18020 [Phycisphaerae bacterium]|nr:hypothetical protein [Phycisphaerae bacterium]
MNCIYVTASALDARYTRICVASIRHFYPDVAIKLLPGGALEDGLQHEVARYWNVGMAEVRCGDWGWGFVKLEPLFGPPGKRFLVLDSDTVFVGDVLGTWADSTAYFLVDDEQQSEADTQRLYYNWRKIAVVDPAARPPRFVFNSGQWFGTSGIVTREDFGLLIDWSRMPPKLRHPDLLMPGDQGVLNYVLNQKAMIDGVSVERRKIMRWPGHGMDGISAATVAGHEAPPIVVHWAGFKKPYLGAMPGADVLALFEKAYYAKIPFGPLLRRLRAARYFCGAMLDTIATRARLLARRLLPSVRIMSASKA